MSDLVNLNYGSHMNIPARKTCNRCGIEHPVTREFFGQYKNKRGGEVSIGFRGTCRKCMSEHTKAYDAKNPDNVAARISRRRKRTSAAGGAARGDLPRIRRFLDDKCRFCSIELQGVGHVDHLTPLARGGTNGTNNLTLCCEACNLAKTSKTLDEFIEWRRERGMPIREVDVPGERPDPVTRSGLRERY